MTTKRHKTESVLHENLWSPGLIRSQLQISLFPNHRLWSESRQTPRPQKSFSFSASHFLPAADGGGVTQELAANRGPMQDDSAAAVRPWKRFNHRVTPATSSSTPSHLSHDASHSGHLGFPFHLCIFMIVIDHPVTIQLHVFYCQ